MTTGAGGHKLTTFWTSVRACDLCARFPRIRVTSVGGNGSVSGETSGRPSEKAHAQRPAGRTVDRHMDTWTPWTPDSGHGGVGTADREQMLIVLISQVRRKHAAKCPIAETRPHFRHIDALVHGKQILLHKQTFKLKVSHY